MKFFVPSAFEKNSEALKFQPTGSNNNEQFAKLKKKKNKKKSKKRPSISAGKGPLAPKHMHEDEDETMEVVKTVKSGKIEKKNNKNKQKLKLKATPALAQAIKESLQQNDIKENESEMKMEDDVMQEEEEQQTASTPLNSFAAKLKEQLMGGRFRFINEQLYTMDSPKAEKLFKEDPQAFQAYHDGYRHQVEKWPMNPLKRIIKMINKLPKSMEIGDFGCGEGKLSKSVPHKVYSMDLVSCRTDIIACDMASTPLKTHTLDVAVYCLSLMGTNLKDYLLEANRVLKIDGFMYIAEIQSRFENVKDFVRKLDSFGFQLVKQDVGQKVFYFFQFKKVRNVGKVAKVPDMQLKPCIYRKR